MAGDGEGRVQRAFEAIGANNERMTSIHEDAIFATEIAYSRNRAWVSDTTGHRVLIEPADAEAVGVVADGTRLAWQQGYGRTDLTRYERMELWTAPYTTDPSALVPRRVADLSLRAFVTMVMNGRYVARAVDRTRVEVLDLDDGTRRVIDAPPGRGWGYLLFAGPEEVGLMLQSDPSRAILELRFYRYDALPTLDESG